MSAGPVTFKVVINHVECEGLDPTPENGPEDDRDVEPTTNPYVTFSWPGRPQFKTKHLKGTLNPFYEDWEEQFYYSTRFPDQLRVKKILVSVFSWSRWKSHRKIGHCEVNLATIACGPLAHRRTLTAGNGDPAGIISFEIEMMEVVRSMKLELLNLSLPSWIPNPTPGAQVCIDYFLSARPEETFRTRSLPASRPPAWPKSKALRTKVQVGELLDYNFEFLVNFVVRGKCVPFLKSSCSFLDLVEKKRPSKHISLPLVLVSDTKKQAGTIVFDAKVTNGPRFCQITDPHSSHSDKGVIHNGPVSKYFPLPPRGIIKKATDKNPFLFPVTPVAPHRGIGEEEKAKSLQDNCQPSNTWIIEPRPKRATPEDELIPLPRFWSLRVEQSTGYVRFMYRPTKKDTYQDPRGLPGGWSQCLSSRGELYWYQSSTGGTTKTDPRGMPPDWHLVMQKEGKGFAETFVYQHMTSCLHDPRGLPEAFSQHLTPTGKVYYMDHQRRDTTFQDPRTLMPKQMLSALVYNDILKYMSAYWANAESLIAVEKKRKQQEYETMVAEKEMEAKHEAKINSLDQRLLDWVEGEARKWVQIANAKDEDYRSKEKQWMVEKHELEDKLTKEIQDWEKEFLQKALTICILDKTPSFVTSSGLQQQFSISFVQPPKTRRNFLFPLPLPKIS